MRTPNSMYGACHAKLHARAMARVGGANSEGGRLKTPDFGLVEAEGTLFRACTNKKSCMRMPRMPHAATCPQRTLSSHFYGNGARWKGRRRGRSGERTTNLLHQSLGDGSRMARHLDASPSLISISQARLFRSSRFFVWGLSRALGPRSVPSEWLRLRSGFSKGSQVTALTINRN